MLIRRINVVCLQSKRRNEKNSRMLGKVIRYCMLRRLTIENGVGQ